MAEFLLVNFDYNTAISSGGIAPWFGF